MDFALTEEQELFRKTVRQFAERELLPRYAERERPDYSILELRRKMAALGLPGLRAPAEYGGSDAPYVTVGVAAEELGRGDHNVGNLLVSLLLSTELIPRLATKAVKDEWLRDVVSGERQISFAITEPHCGSDALALKATAARDGDEYVICGEKSSIGQAGHCEGVIVFARTSDAPGARGISAILVPTDLPGVSIARCNDLGMKFAHLGDYTFDGVRVPIRNLLGSEGQGFYACMNGFDVSRTVIALVCIGTAQKTIEETVAYVKTRHAFGQPLARFEGISFPIAEAATILEAARLLCFKALWLRDQGLPHTKEAAMAKWMGPKFAFDTIHQMLLLHGHAGYSNDLPIAQRLRDVIGLEIGDGSAEIMKGLIGRELMGREFRPW